MEYSSFLPIGKLNNWRPYCTLTHTNPRLMRWFNLDFHSNELQPSNQSISRVVEIIFISILLTRFWAAWAYFRALNTSMANKLKDRERKKNVKRRNEYPLNHFSSPLNWDIAWNLCRIYQLIEYRDIDGYSCCGLCHPSTHTLVKVAFENLCHQIMNSVASRVNWPLRILWILCTAIMDIEIKRKTNRKKNQKCMKTQSQIGLNKFHIYGFNRFSVKDLNKIMFRANDWSAWCKLIANAVEQNIDCAFSVGLSICLPRPCPFVCVWSEDTHFAFNMTNLHFSTSNSIILI